MSWLDIVVIILLAFALWEGWRQGFIRQTLGLVAIVLGIFLAWRFGAALGTAFGLKETTAAVVGFITILIAVILLAALVGRMTRGLFRLVGLGVFDNILGVALSGLKMLLVVGIVLMLADFLDAKETVITREIKKSSPMYKAATGVAAFVFPYVDTITGKVWERGRKTDEPRHREGREI